MIREVLASLVKSASVEAGTLAPLPGNVQILVGQKLNMQNLYKIINLVDPTNAQDAATKFYVDGAVAGSTLTAGDGIEILAQAIYVKLDGATLSRSASGLKVSTGGITNNEVNASAAIAYSKLALSNSIVNADIASAAAIAYSKLALSNSIVNADINSAAAIAYSKLNLVGSIVNADVNAAAAIDYSKLFLTGMIVDADIAAGAAIVYSKLDLSASIVNSDVAAGAAIAYSKLNLSASIVNADVASGAAIAYSKLDLLGSIVNADVAVGAAIAYSKLNLTGGIVNADVSASAAIAYSKLALSNSIVDSDVNSAAAIAYSKLAALGGSTGAVLVQSGAGFVSASAIASANLILSTGTVAFTADQSMGSNKLTNLLDPTNAQDAATKFYVDNNLAGLTWKNSARAASVGNLVLATMPATVDGVTLLSGERFLAKDQTLPAQNGIYIFNGTGNAATRSTDMDSWTEVDGAVLLVESGTVNGGSKWVNTNVPGGTLGTTAINFTAFSVSGQITGSGTAGYNAYWNGTTSLAAEQYIAQVRGGLGTDATAFTGVVKAVAGTFSASSIVNGDVDAAAAISYSKLNLAGSIVNADVATGAAIVYSKLSLTGSIVNADVNASAAIAYSKLALSNSIVNADINASAAIAYSKLALSNSIVNADINSAAAIAYSKLNLVGSIVDADVNASAAIAYSKLALSNSIVDADINSSAAISYSKLNLVGQIVNADVSASAAIAYSKLALTASIVNADIAAGAAIAYSKLNLALSIVNADVSASAAIAYSKLNLALSIVNGDIAAGAAIAYSKLALSNSIVNADINASAAIAYSKLALSNSIVNADINASAAIAYSKLNLSNSIVDADVNSAAAISLSKLASLTANRALVSDGSGVISASSVTATELGYSSGTTSNVQAQLNARGRWVKYTKSFSDLAVAALTNDIELFSLVAKEAIQGVVIKHSAAFTGGAISAYSVSVGITGSLDKYGSSFDVFQAAGSNVSQSTNELGVEDFAGATSIRIAAVSVGANLNAATAGSVDVWVCLAELP